jgi:voltage-gated potassium channel
MYGSSLEKLNLHQRGRLRNTRLWREWCFIRAALKQFAGRLLLLAVCLFGGGIVFQLVESESELSLVEGTYASFMLLFGEPVEDFPQSFIGRSLFFILPLLGFTVLLQAILDFAFLLRDRRRYEKGWCRIMAHGYSDHVILIGLGRLGFRIWKLLRQLGHPVVIIDRKEENPFLEEVRREGSPVFFGDARQATVLRDANVKKARSIILATSDDLSNLEIAIDARAEAPDIRVVMRMFDQNLADKIAHGFNIHNAMSQSTISAPAFALRAIETDAIGSFTLHNQLIVIKRWKIAASSSAVGMRIAELMKQHKVTVVEHGLADGTSELMPDLETTLQANQHIVAQGTIDSMKKMQQWIGSAATPAVAGA